MKKNNKKNEKEEELEFLMGELKKEEIIPASSDFMISKKSLTSQKKKK